MLYTWTLYNIVQQLYLNKKKEFMEFISQIFIKKRDFP